MSTWPTNCAGHSPAQRSRSASTMGQRRASPATCRPIHWSTSGRWSTPDRSWPRPSSSATRTWSRWRTATGPRCSRRCRGGLRRSDGLQLRADPQPVDDREDGEEAPPEADDEENDPYRPGLPEDVPLRGGVTERIEEGEGGEDGSGEPDEGDDRHQRSV